MTYTNGETVLRDRRIPVENSYNPARPTVPGWGDVDDEGLETIELPGCYVAATSQSAFSDAARQSVQIGKSLYSTDRDVDVAIGDRIRTAEGFAYYVNVRPAGDINPFTGWSPGVEIPLDGEVG